MSTTTTVAANSLGEMIPTLYDELLRLAEIRTDPKFQQIMVRATQPPEWN